MRLEIGVFGISKEEIFFYKKILELMIFFEGFFGFKGNIIGFDMKELLNFLRGFILCDV